MYPGFVHQPQFCELGQAFKAASGRCWNPAAPHIYNRTPDFYSRGKKMRPAKNLVFYQTLAPAARNCGGRGFSRTDLIETRGLRVAAGSRNCAEARVRAINCGTRGFAQLRAIVGFAPFFFLSRLSFQRFLPRPIRNRASREHFSQLKGSPPRAIARGGDPFS